MRQRRGVVLASAAMAGFLLSGPAPAAAEDPTTATLGRGTVGTYALIDAKGQPREIGIVLSKDALEGLPPERNRTSRCFDLDSNGAINESGECEGDYQVNLSFPAELGRHEIPFLWSMVNWNPEGHPPEAWALPHFDVHFYQVPRSEVEAIRLGPCGIFMNCDDFKRATRPVDAKYVNAEHVSVGAAVGLMGNHLIDSRTPELGTPPSTFTHTWIFGAYDGGIIFHEVMVTRDFLLNAADECHDIKQPTAWQAAGYYPTRYCFRRESSDGSLKVFMTDFVLRSAG